LNEDLYVVLTAIESDGSATVKIHHNPLVNWGWTGGGIFVVGCLIVLWPHPERSPQAARSSDATAGGDRDDLA
jgi:cytochrome c biogenesis factor